jgi:hypothetical protein
MISLKQLSLCYLNLDCVGFLCGLWQRSVYLVTLFRFAPSPLFSIISVHRRAEQFPSTAHTIEMVHYLTFLLSSPPPPPRPSDVFSLQVFHHIHYSDKHWCPLRKRKTEETANCSDTCLRINKNLYRVRSICHSPRAGSFCLNPLAPSYPTALGSIGPSRKGHISREKTILMTSARSDQT